MKQRTGKAVKAWSGVTADANGGINLKVFHQMPLSDDELAQLCVLLERFQQQGADVDDAYQAVFDAGVKACGGKSLEFYNLCNTKKG